MSGYNSTSRYDSQTIPGVVFILKKLTEGRRLELRKMLAEPQAKMSLIMKELAKHNQLPEDQQDASVVSNLSMEFDDVLYERIHPTWVKWGLKSVEGLVIDGTTLTAENIMDFPSELFEEILNTVMGGTQLSTDQSKNSESPSTFGKLEGGRTKNTTAEPAESSDTTEQETVGATSQAE